MTPNRSDLFSRFVGCLICFVLLCESNQFLFAQHRLHGVENQRPEDNAYDKKWIDALTRKGLNPFSYHNKEEMTAEVLKRIGKDGCISELNLYGHGNPGFFSLGNGQSDEFVKSTYISNHNPDSIAEWKDALQPVQGRFCVDAKLRLIGCNVGGNELGAEIVFAIADFFKVTVLAPVNKVYGGRNYKRPWQQASPSLSKPPQAIRPKDYQPSASRNRN